MPPNEADLAVNHQGWRKQHIHRDDPLDIGNVLDSGPDAQPGNGRLHVGLQLPTFRTAGT